jgi:hypothetical protein
MSVTFHSTMYDLIGLEISIRAYAGKRHPNGLQQMATIEPSATSVKRRARLPKRRSSSALPLATIKASTGAIVALACTFDQSAATGSASHTSGPSMSSSSR